MIIIRKPKKKKDEIEIVKINGKIEDGVEIKDNQKIFANYKKIGNKYKLYRCRLGDKLIQPSKVIELLKREDIFILKGNEEIGELLKSYNLKFDYIKLCPFCLLKNIYKRLTRNNRCKYGNLEICIDCGVREIREEVRINEEFIEKLLRRFKDVDKVLSLLRIRNPLNNPELTRYDIIICSKEDKIRNYKIDELNIPEELRKIIKDRGIYELLPVQTLAVKGGLLKGEDLLIVSATSSGKTLIGELAGIKNLIEKGKKFLFLVPLVALANQKYLEFKERYEKLGFKVSLRVGLGRIGKKSDDIETSLDADIIVGTYEGIDYLIRTKKLKDVGTVVIDEIHSLNMEERGARLDGLIGRLRFLFKDAQKIYLSATIGNPKELSKQLNAKLVLYNGRPVPLERHIIFCKNEFAKLSIIRDIVKREWQTISKFGYRGQCLIFTYSRKRAEYIAKSLKSKGIKAEFYHGGMEYLRRRKVEEDFANQKIQCVVTTAALSAGVDFPASTVILESLAMGAEWLNPAEFQQMCGRAGRKGMHEIGKVYLLVEIGKKYHMKMENTEDEVAFKLLNAVPEDVKVEYSEDEEEEQILATISAGIENIKDIDRVPYLGRVFQLNKILNSLESYSMIKIYKDKVKLTNYGKSAAISFLYPKIAEKIKEGVLENKPILELITEIMPFENVYISNNLKIKLSKILNINIPSRFFDALEVIRENMQKIEKIGDKKLKDDLISIIVEFEGVNVEEKILELIINLRLSKKTPGQISKTLYIDYKIQTYSGDIYYYLEQLLNLLDAIERIANIFNKKYAEKVHKLKERIENP
ncbi:DEAD/DEAH box helicase domain protein [Methanocaldococcus lauensis]|nr:DEAD/DEAH box helicase domain protein [Methanocaldococcus lauensis]